MLNFKGYRVTVSTATVSEHPVREDKYRHELVISILDPGYVIPNNESLVIYSTNKELCLSELLQEIEPLIEKRRRSYERMNRSRVLSAKYNSLLSDATSYLEKNKQEWGF